MKSIVKRVGAWLLVFMFSIAVAIPNGIVANAVTPSATEYTVLLNGPRYFIHNKKTAGSEVGTEYYMTYTVKSAKQVPTQHGLVGTEDCTRNFPYNPSGLMRYIGESQYTLLDEGYTYFVKFTVEKGGFLYNVTRAKGNEIEDIYMDKIFGTAEDKMGYFGIFMAYDYVEAELTDVRFYDAKGNDLGVAIQSPTKTGMVFKGDSILKADTTIDHRYDVSIDQKRNIAISNLRVPATSKIYIEYKVDSAEYLLNQEGIALSNEPTSDYPHRYAALRHTTYSEIVKSIDFLDVGAEYIVLIDRSEDAFNVLVQKTKNGKMSQTMLSSLYGTYSSDFDFASLWFGAGGETEATFKLTDVKIYDEKKNNLGVQTNVTSSIMHYGELEDYSGCKAAYYCEDNGNVIALYEDQTMKHTVGDATEEATYKISERIMKVQYSAREEVFDYLYRKITDENKDEYRRLYHYKLEFVTGTDEEIATQNFSNETGYYATKPDEPTMEEYEFQGWYTSDGVEYNFDSIVTKSDVVYAKWSDDAGRTFLAGENDTTNISEYFVYVAGALLVLVGLAVCIILARKGVRNGKK